MTITGLGRYVLMTAATLLLAGVMPAAAKECRMPKAPPGVALQVPPECQHPLTKPADKAETRERLRAENGFVDLGGTQIRVGGRVRAEAGYRH